MHPTVCSREQFPTMPTIISCISDAIARRIVPKLKTLKRLTCTTLQAASFAMMLAACACTHCVTHCVTQSCACAIGMHEHHSLFCRVCFRGKLASSTHEFIPYLDGMYLIKLGKHRAVSVCVPLALACTIGAGSAYDALVSCSSAPARGNQTRATFERIIRIFAVDALGPAAGSCPIASSWQHMHMPAMCLLLDTMPWLWKGFPSAVVITFEQIRYFWVYSLDASVPCCPLPPAGSTCAHAADSNVPATRCNVVSAQGFSQAQSSRNGLGPAAHLHLHVCLDSVTSQPSVPTVLVEESK